MLRLQRVGRRNDPKFRIVATDKQNSTKSGRFIEILGFYEPAQDRSEVAADRVQYWIGKGAQVSGTLHNMLIDKKIITGKKINVLPKKTRSIKDAPAAVAPAKKEEATAAPEAEVVETPIEAATEEKPAE